MAPASVPTVRNPNGTQIGAEENTAVTNVPTSDPNRESVSVWDSFALNVSESERLTANNVRESLTAGNTHDHGGCLTANEGMTMPGGADELRLPVTDITLSPTERTVPFTGSLTPIGNPVGRNPLDATPSSPRTSAEHYSLASPDPSDDELVIDDEEMELQIQLGKVQERTLRLQLEHRRRRANQSQTLSDGLRFDLSRELSMEIDRSRRAQRARPQEAQHSEALQQQMVQFQSAQAQQIALLRSEMETAVHNVRLQYEAKAIEDRNTYQANHD